MYGHFAVANSPTGHFTPLPYHAQFTQFTAPTVSRCLNLKKAAIDTYRSKT